MKEARAQFEAILMTKGKRASVWDGEKYVNSNIQTYWRWFLLGWTMIFAAFTTIWPTAITATTRISVLTR